jgi:hypothetical protein
MDSPAEKLTNPIPRRPRDLALLLLAIGTEPPRARARDQQADRLGAELRRRVLDRLAALDPEPDALDQALASIVAEAGEPSGPTRGVCSQVRKEWEQARIASAFWEWLIAEALERTARDEPTTGRNGGARGNT